MNQALYFIPILERALRKPDPRQALESAFREIASLGTRPEFAEGAEHFRRFMAIAAQEEPAFAEDFWEHAESVVQDLILLLGTHTETFAGDAESRQMALQLIESRAEWKTQYEQALELLSGDQPSADRLQIEVIASGAPIGTITIPEHDTKGFLTLHSPGDYLLLLITGRAIWGGHLSAKHLLLHEAFPDALLPMAADTQGLSTLPTLEAPLLGGEAVLRVYCGFEAGQMEVELTRPTRREESR